MPGAHCLPAAGPARMTAACCPGCRPGAEQRVRQPEPGCIRAPSRRRVHPELSATVMRWIADDPRRSATPSVLSVEGWVLAREANRRRPSPAIVGCRSEADDPGFAD